MLLSGYVFPVRGDVPQRQANQLRCPLVAGEMPLVANRLADLAVQALEARVRDFDSGVRPLPDPDWDGEMPSFGVRLYAIGRVLPNPDISIPYLLSASTCISCRIVASSFHEYR